MGWDQKRDRYEEGNKDNIQWLEALIEETRLPHVPGLVPPKSEDIPTSPCGHHPRCAGGTQTGFERQGLIKDGKQVRNGR